VLSWDNIGHICLYVANHMEIEEKMSNMHFPLIVKHFNGAGSEGMRESSKVYTLQQLFSEIDRMAESFGGAMIEEFITGILNFL